MKKYDYNESLKKDLRNCKKIKNFRKRETLIFTGASLVGMALYGLMKSRGLGDLESNYPLMGLYFASYLESLITAKKLKESKERIDDYNDTFVHMPNGTVINAKELADELKQAFIEKYHFVENPKMYDDNELNEEDAIETQETTVEDYSGMLNEIKLDEVRYNANLQLKESKERIDKHDDTLIHLPDGSVINGKKLEDELEGLFEAKDSIKESSKTDDITESKETAEEEYLKMIDKIKLDEEYYKVNNSDFNKVLK